MGLQYVAEARLRSMMLEIVRGEVPSCYGVELIPLPGPFRPENWRIGQINVMVADYRAARAKADALQAMRHWVCVPDGHLLDGQIYEPDAAPSS